MNINWNAFFVVGIATLVGALVVVTLFLPRCGCTQRAWTVPGEPEPGLE
ncbi:hypothetical protein RSal33209_2303 [Renibacterium salmoninarum ATCC 33209]|uniref:Uncharacterized protein n=1 Tax=Renibacterium salmoninarum (strain ATCC 33209 / DSM 20767 / JCM 11484 / NBRC 15589 / NCIMB 2235) TaxID=288705 RepID=A9WT96_RENSM|nr:hypothetical protein [Renibacterium salmoninarum]ABY24034.1 hypothetical protein RSal33209_2303 [Renibacterium salmoninarum ATCC 33209]